MVDDRIDFPVSPLFAAYFAERGMTKPLPDGFPIEQPQRFVPLPIENLNEVEWEERGEALLSLIGWWNSAANTWPLGDVHNHLPETADDDQEPMDTPAQIIPIAPRPTRPQGGQAMPPTAPEEPEHPAPKLIGKWRHV